MLRNLSIFLAVSVGLMTSTSAQTTTVYNLGSGVCVHSNNCTIYANNETQSLWWDYSTADTGFVIFELASWTPSYHAVKEYVCGDPYITPGGAVGSATFTGSGGTCQNVDSDGLPFSMTYSYQVTSYIVKVGSGRGGGGAGVRYRVTGLTVSITQ